MFVRGARPRLLQRQRSWLTSAYFGELAIRRSWKPSWSDRYARNERMSRPHEARRLLAMGVASGSLLLMRASGLEPPPTTVRGGASISASPDWSEAEITDVRAIAFNATEATFASVDLAPDGKRLVFDMLGELYAIPSSGGAATRLTDGRSWNAEPRFSPDGRQILFVSDRSGSSNIWTMASDGSRASQMTFDTAGAFYSPTWISDGIVARRRSTLENLPSQLVVLKQGETEVTPIATGTRPLDPVQGFPARKLVYSTSD